MAKIREGGIMTTVLKEIKFDNNYPKLHDQKAARLLMVIQDVSGELLNNEFYYLMKYDSLRDDGLLYNIKPDETYMLLLFLGDKNILFSTLRKQNEENAILYAESVGEIFKIEIKTEGGDNGSKQRIQG